MARGQHTAKALRTRAGNSHIRVTGSNDAGAERTVAGSKGSSFKNASLGLLLGVAVVIAGVVALSGPNASAAQGTKVAQTPAPACPTGDSCVTIPCSSGTCPTIEAAPTSDIGISPTQSVFINLYNFPPGDQPAIWLCADVKPLAQAAPMCSTAPSPEYAPIFSDGSGFVTYPVPEVENDGNPPINGEVLGDPSQDGTFYCDNGPDLCSLDVFDTSLDGSSTPDATNTAVLPVTYAASGGGCPKATLLETESEFGIEGLLGTANTDGCTGSTPAIAFNTAVDSLDAVRSLTSGVVQIAFTDDPEAADEQAAFKAGGGHYALIPVAASADVVGFAGYISPNSVENRTLYPHTSFELTPNMVAGLLNTTYNDPDGADLIASKCLNPGIQPPKTLDPCPAMEALNSISGFLPEEEYSAYVRSDNAGVTDELFKWLCAAPDHTVVIGKKTDTEPDTAAQVLEATDWADASLDGTCPDTDQFPALGGEVVLNADKNPQNQAKALFSAVSLDSTPPRQAGFAIMNWYESLYYGLLPAELQNAAGQFVSPSAASVDAALGDATTNPDGTLNFNYADTTDTAAYPEPVVFYAAVSTKSQPAAQATAERTVLDNILALTGAPGSSSLPAGILPLTSTLTSQAETDVAKDIIAEPPTKSGTPGGNKGSGGSSTTTTGQKTGGGTSTTQTGGGSSDTGGGGLNTETTTTGNTVSPTAAHTIGTTGRQGRSAPKPTRPSPKPGGVFHAVAIALAAPEWRWLLSVMLIVGAIAVGGGPLLLMAQRLRRRLAGIRHGRD
jgi:hypothetical protein